MVSPKKRNTQTRSLFASQPGQRAQPVPFVPGPNPDLPEFIAEHSTPYNSQTDKYNLPAFDLDCQIDNAAEPKDQNPRARRLAFPIHRATRAGLPYEYDSPVGRRSQPDRCPRCTSMVAQDGPCVSVPPRMATWDLRNSSVNNATIEWHSNRSCSTCCGFGQGTTAW